MVKLKLKQINILLFILACTGLKSQNRKIYLTNDSIHFEKPIIISDIKKEGFFILEEKDVNNNYEKMILSENTYIYIYNIFDYIDEINMDEININYHTCEFSSLKYSKNIGIRKLDDNVKNFRIGYIELNYYIDNSLSTNEKKSNYKKVSNKIYYKFIIANCGN